MNNEHQTEDQAVETEVEEVESFTSEPLEDDEFQAPAVVETLQNKLQLAGITPDTLIDLLPTLKDWDSRITLRISVSRIDTRTVSCDL